MHRQEKELSAYGLLISIRAYDCPGDMSELVLALTTIADTYVMYGVNSSVPKTLIHSIVNGMHSLR